MLPLALSLLPIGSLLASDIFSTVFIVTHHRAENRAFACTVHGKDHKKFQCSEGLTTDSFDKNIWILE